MGSSYSDDLYRLLLQQLQEGVVLTDADGTIVFVNNAAERIRNVSRADLLGGSIISCHKSESHEKVLRAIQYLKEHPDKTYHRMVTDTANQKIYENTYASVRNDLGELGGMAVISRDMTERRKAEESQANYLRVQRVALENMKAQYHSLLLTSMELLTNLLEARDVYTNGHSKRVAEITSKLYEYKYGISDTYLDLQWAAKLHDIGKICIPDRIIDKPGKLTEEEYEIIKRHSGIAADLLKPLDPGDRITSVVRHHHERFDGTGYPDGLTGNEIPLGSRIIAIADTYDAMNSCRPYRDALTYPQCLAEIRRNSGKQFDPEWVEVFLELAGTGSID